MSLACSAEIACDREEAGVELWMKITSNYHHITPYREQERPRERIFLTSKRSNVIDGRVSGPFQPRDSSPPLGARLAGLGLRVMMSVKPHREAMCGSELGCWYGSTGPQFSQAVCRRQRRIGVSGSFKVPLTHGRPCN
jgi:hypothetical protein